jgi:tetratricopeptide (TPR) repeat protein
MNRRRSKIIVCLLLIMATLVVYWPVKDYPFVSLDDPGYITQNRRVKAGWTKEGAIWAFTTMHHRHWHPLTWLSHMTDVQFFGLDAGWHHLISLFFHIANTLLLLLILNRVTGAIWRSAFVAALFAVHPLHVETVTWVADRKDLLCVFFWLLAMGAYAHYAERPGLLRYALVFLLYVLALMAKSMAVTLPLAFLLMDLWPLGRFQFIPSEGEDQSRNHNRVKPKYQRASVLRLVGEKIFFFLILGVGLVVTLVAVHKGQAASLSNLIINKGYIASALVSYVTYIVKMIWPQNLATPYPWTFTAPLGQALGAGTVLLLVSILFFRWARQKPYLLSGWLWYLVTLVPVIGLVQGGPHTMGDRYTYIPLIGLFFITAWGVSDILAGWRLRRVVLVTAAVIAISGLMTASRLQLRHWQSSISLYTHAIAVTADNAIAHNNLGNALRRKGRLDEAIPHYAEAVRISPNYATAHRNLANALKRQGKLEEAEKHYAAARRIKSNSVRVRAGSRKTDQKQEKPLKAGSRDPAATLTRMGNALMQKGRLKLAMRHYTEALRLNPDSAGAHRGLALALKRQGRFEEAIQHYDEVLRINPSDRKASEKRKAALQLMNKSMDVPGPTAEPQVP